MLLWIACKLLLNQDEGEGGTYVAPTAGFRVAMMTIIVADAVMGLDNVLAVAGAAHGSFLLVVLGLLISIPIVIWGSQLILGVVQRFPIIVYVVVLAWTGGKMMLREPLIAGHVLDVAAFTGLVYALAVGGIFFAGKSDWRSICCTCACRCRGISRGS